MLHADSVAGASAQATLDEHVRGGARPTMRTLEIDGSTWRSRRDFYDALSDALGSVERDCRSSRSLLETMVFHVDLNAERPPYAVVIKDPSDEFRPFLRDFANSIAEARQHRAARWGDDVEVAVIVS